VVLIALTGKVWFDLFIPHCQLVKGLLSSRWRQRSNSREFTTEHHISNTIIL